MSATHDGVTAEPNSTMSRLESHRQRSPFFVAVTGGLGAGKTTFSRKLAQILSVRNTVTLIDLDSHESNLRVPSAAKPGVRVDARELLDLTELVEIECRLKHGRPTTKPSYDRHTHARDSGGSMWPPGDIIMVEGALVSADDRLWDLFDLRLFIDTPADIRLRRRLERELREAGCSLADAIEHYIAVVVPMHEQFIEPAKASSDVVIPGWEDADVSFKDLASLIWRRLDHDAVSRSSPALTRLRSTGSPRSNYQVGMLEMENGSYHPTMEEIHE
ncbi:MAG: uridine kinase family protein [Nitrospiraceae bacterium]